MKMICPHCGLKGTAEETLFGKKVRCPECQQVFKIDDEVTFTDSPCIGDDTLEQGAVTETLSADPVDTDSSDQVKDTEPEEAVVEEAPVLPEGVLQCSKCKFAFSEQFVSGEEAEPICAVCAG